MILGRNLLWRIIIVIVVIVIKVLIVVIDIIVVRIISVLVGGYSHNWRRVGNKSDSIREALSRLSIRLLNVSII